MFNHAVYKNSPVWVQEYLISIRSLIRKSLREDRVFRKLLADALLKQYWSFEQLEDLHKEQLDSVLNLAEACVPFYRQRDTGILLMARDVLQKLAQLPLLRKKDVMRDPTAFIATNVPKWSQFSIFTSGTTGTPLVLTQTMDSVKRENVFIRRQMYWAGYKEGDKLAWMRGDMIVPFTNRKPPFWRLNRTDNSLMMSSYHLSAENAPAYLDALRQFDPALIQAYPSSIAYLANWLLSAEQKADIPSLKGIMTSSETLTDEQREQIEIAFGVRVFDWYGGVERVAAIGSCEYGRYHIIEDYSFVELKSSGDGLAEIIGTSFNNAAMPLIRYVTGDSVELESPESKCLCKRDFRLVKRIMGRLDAVIKTPDGRSIGRLDIYKGIFGIVEAQVVQESLDAIEIRVVPSQNGMLSKKIKDRLINNIQSRIGFDMTVQIVEVKSLPRTKNGKLLGVISTLT